MPREKKSRRETFWDLYDFGRGRGLEIGPLHRTMIPRDEADVRYVDVQDRAGLVAHYADDAGVDTDLIPEIDYFLIQPDGRTLSLSEATAAGAPFDWVMASHVIEHVPDVIGWLEEIAEVTSDGAALVLAVPDRRYCFDVNRPPTTVGQMIQAHEAGDTRPSVRAVYDYVSSVVDYRPADLWRGDTPAYDRRIHSLQEACDKVAATLDGTYVDSHVWLFSPQSFLEQLHELRITGRSAWMVEVLEPTEVHDIEFKAVLRRLPRDADATAPQPQEVRTAASRPDWLTLPEPSELVRGLETRIAELETQLAERRDKLQVMRRRLRQERATVASLRADLERRPRGLRARGRTAVAGALHRLQRR